MLLSPVLALVLLQGSDTLRIREAVTAPRFDGVVTDAEYGNPTVTLPTAQGGVKIWVVRSGDTAYVAARIAGLHVLLGR